MIDLVQLMRWLVAVVDINALAWAEVGLGSDDDKRNVWSTYSQTFVNSHRRAKRFRPESLATKCWYARTYVVSRFPFLIWCGVCM